MLKLKYSFIAVLVSACFISHAQVDFKKADKSNTWLKIGVNTALPILALGETHKVGLGLDASIQFLETKASGIGAKVGYVNYFAKGTQDDVGVLPLAIMWRYYPESAGWFAGLEVAMLLLAD